MPKSATSRSIDCVAGERREAGQPGVDRPAEDERHQSQIQEVDRHVGERAGQRDVAVAAGFGPLFGRLLLGRLRTKRRVGMAVGVINTQLATRLYLTFANKRRQPCGESRILAAASRGRPRLSLWSRHFFPQAGFGGGHLIYGLQTRPARTVLAAKTVAELNTSLVNTATLASKYDCERMQYWQAIRAEYSLSKLDQRLG